MKRIVFAVWIAIASACVTSPLGRRQLILFPDREVNAMGVRAFQEVKKSTPPEMEAEVNEYVRCVAMAVAAAARRRVDAPSWEVVVFRKSEANAFALPGGKIGVYTGLLKIARTPPQLAAVIGHEIGHVIARHGNERISESLAAESVLSVADVLAEGNPRRNAIMGLLGVGAQLGVLLPHSRAQESEADRIGLDLMARAGFDPRQSIDLWRNMEHSGGGAPPEFLSTHPSHATRIRDLQAGMNEALIEYDRAQARGLRPACAP